MELENDKIKLTDILGSGSFGQTWKAIIKDKALLRELRCDTIVAVKLPNGSDNTKLFKDVQMNMGLNINLKKEERKHIVGFYGVEAFNDKLICIMEYVPGGNLNQFLNRQLTPQSIIPIVKGILKGLIAIHQRQIVHLDIKPENILFNGECAKIADLGVGKVVGSNGLISSGAGTILYMSPEIINGFKEVSYNTDIWSVGVTFYQMLYGCYPFGMEPETMVIQDIINRIINHGVKFPDHIPVSDSLKNIISKSLEKDPKHRYPDAKEMLNDLENINKTDEKLLTKINECIQNKEYSAAIKEINILQKQYPNSGQLYLKLGTIYNLEGKQQLALKAFEEGITKDPDCGLLYFDSAILLKEARNPQKAKEYLLKAIKLGIDKRSEMIAKAFLNNI